MQDLGVTIDSSRRDPTRCFDDVGAEYWMTFEEMAWEFAEVFDELQVDQINEILAKNVPFETLEFFGNYASEFAKAESIEGKTGARLPNLMLIGYLLRVLEERLEPSDD